MLDGKKVKVKATLVHRKSKREMKIYGIQEYRDLGWGESLFIIGNGSSLIKSDLERLPKDKVMTVNRSWKLLPSKLHTIIMHSGYIKDVANMKDQPEVLFVAGAAAEAEAKYKKMLRNEVVFIPRKTPGWKGITPAEFMSIDTGWYPTHTGIFAIQIAVYMGYENIFLLGFDGYGCHFEADEINPLDDHERHKEELKFLKEAIHATEDGLTNDSAVYNLNPANAYNVFPKISFEDALDIAKGDF